MIIRASFRGPGGLAEHLTRVDTNETVRIRDDLSLGCELEVPAALDDFAALGVDIANERSLVHFAISPSLRLTPEQELRTLAEVRRAYEISDEQPVLFLEHDKPGDMDRPPHYHAVFPRRDFRSGRLIRDSFYRQINDRLAVQLDAEFSAPAIVPVVHRKSVETWLAQNAPDTLEQVNARGGVRLPTDRPQRSTAADKKRAADLGVDLGAFGDRVFDVLESRGRDPMCLTEADWISSGLRLARGDKATMVIDLMTGHCASLSRTLNAAAKRRGLSRRWREADIGGLARDAASLSAVLAAMKRFEDRHADSPPKPRRGRSPRASADEIAAEVRRIKRDAAEARERVWSLQRTLRRPDRTARRIALIGFVLTGNPHMALVLWGLAAVYRLARRRRLRALQARLRRDGDARARLAEYFERLRAQRVTPPRLRQRGGYGR